IMHMISRLIITRNAVMIIPMKVITMKAITMKAIIMMPIAMAAKGIRMMSIIIRDVTMLMPRKSILMKATITAMRGIVAPLLQNN
ncbi:hypothetical protein, partial [Klebsiella pneumoniae]